MNPCPCENCKAIRDVEALKARYQAEHADRTRHWKKVLELEAKLEKYRTALKEISRETIYTYDDGNEGPYVKYRAKLLATATLEEKP